MSNIKLTNNILLDYSSVGKPEIDKNNLIANLNENVSSYTAIQDCFVGFVNYQIWTKVDNYEFCYSSSGLRGRVFIKKGQKITSTSIIDVYGVK